MFVICFISQWMKRSKHGLFLSPPKKHPNMEKALFDWPIVLQCDVKAKYRLISRKFSGMKFCHPSVPLANKSNQIALFPFFCCFCFVREFSIQGHTKIALSPKWRACSQANVSLSTNTTDKDCHKQRYLIHICEW